MSRIWQRSGFLSHSPALERLARAFLLVLPVWLAACEPAQQAPLKVGMNAWVGHDHLALARDQGLLNVQQVKVIASGGFALKRITSLQRHAALPH